MTKSEDLIKSMNDEELAILLLCFTKSKVIEALKVYHTIPSYLKSAFIKPGQIEMQRRGLITPTIKSDDLKRLEYKQVEGK